MTVFAVTTALIAEAEQAASGPPGLLKDPMMVPMLVFGVMMLVLMMRGGARQRREQAEMLAAIKKGEEVVTAGGIVGTIISVKDTGDEVTLRSDETKIRVLKSSIVRIVPKATPTPETKPV